MNIPPILQGGPVHLPLQVGMTGVEAIRLANTFYLTQLDPTGFKDAQAIVNTTTGLITLELVDPTTNEVVITFVNKSTEADAVPTSPQSSSSDVGGDPFADFNWTDPFGSGSVTYTAQDKEPWLFPPTQIGGWDEVNFFDGMVVGVPYPTEFTDNTAAWRLATLLNSYGVLGGWGSGTLSQRSTAGFELIYAGPSITAPVQFAVPDSGQLVIFKTHYGDQQGYLCLWT